jgi:hypothetical protein
MRVRARVRLRAFLFLLLLLFSFNFRDWKERVRKEDREPARLLFFLLPLYCVCYDADVLLFLSFSVYLFISNEQVEDGLQSREKDPGRVRRQRRTSTFFVLFIPVCPSFSLCVAET